MPCREQSQQTLWDVSVGPWQLWLQLGSSSSSSVYFAPAWLSGRTCGAVHKQRLWNLLRGKRHGEAASCLHWFRPGNSSVWT